MGQANRLQELLKEREKVQVQVATTSTALIKKNEYDKVLNFQGIQELSIENTLKEYLIQKSKEVIHTQVNDAIQLGKIFEEVATELGKKGSPEGIYTEFISYCGFKPRTALRLRKRYCLFQEAPEHCKLIVSLLSVREIEELEKNKEILEEFYIGITLQEAKTLLKGNIQAITDTSMEVREGQLQFGGYSFLESSFQSKIANLSERKQLQAAKLLKKLEELVYEE